MLKHLGTRGLAPTRRARRNHTLRPRLELLEDRIQLGDTILGLSAVALWGLGANSLDALSALDPGAHGDSFAGASGLCATHMHSPNKPEAQAKGYDPGSQHGLVSSLNAAGSLSAEDFRRHEAGSSTIGNCAGAAPIVETGGGLALSMRASAGALAGQMAVYRLADPALPLPQAPLVEVGVSGGGFGAPWLGGAVPFSPLTLAAIGESGGHAPNLFAATGAAASTMRPVNLSFDGSTGQLAIRTNPGDHTVREALAADGFVDVTFDGHDHSSNPSSHRLTARWLAPPALRSPVSASTAAVRIR